MGLFDVFSKGGKYFGKAIAPRCEYCEFGKRASDGNKVLCAKKGLVDAEYHCPKFTYSPLKRIPEKQMKTVGWLEGDYEEKNFEEMLAKQKAKAKAEQEEREAAERAAKEAAEKAAAAMEALAKVEKAEAEKAAAQKAAEKEKAAALKAAEKEKAKAEDLKKDISGKKITLFTTCGDTGKLFGAITTAQISEAVKKQFKITVDKKDIKLGDTIKLLGQYPVKLKLFQGVEVEMILSVEKQ